MSLTDKTIEDTHLVISQDQTWVCDKGHKILASYDAYFAVHFTLANVSTKRLCPYCIVEFLNANISEMHEEKGGDNGSQSNS